MTRITVEQDGESPRKFSLEIPSDLAIYQMLEEIKIVLIAMTYPPSLVEEAFGEEE
jgi:hypothetical protein